MKWSKDNWKTIGTIVLGLLLPMLIINFAMDLAPFDSLSNADDSAWLGFWGGYLGSIVAVGGVYWQVNREKEENIKAARPIFTIMYDDNFGMKINGKLKSYVSDEAFLGDLESIYENCDPLGRQIERGYLLLINNPSANPLLLVLSV